MNLLDKYYEALLSGAFVTIQLAGLSWLIGITLGLTVGFWCTKLQRLKELFSVLAFSISALPVLVLLFWVHYPLQTIFMVNIDPFYTSVFVFSFINITMIAQIIIKADANINKEYIWCAQFASISTLHIFMKIKLPLILRHSIPSIINAQVVILHMTLFASLISVNELFRTAQRINSLEYSPVEIYTITAAFYLLLTIPLLVASNIFKNKTAFKVKINDSL